MTAPTYERALQWFTALAQQLQRDSGGAPWDPAARARTRNAVDAQLVLDRLTQLQGLADTLAGMTTDAEMEGDMSGDDAVSTLSEMIEQARSLSDRRPAGTS